MKNLKKYLLVAGLLYQSATLFAQNTAVAGFTINDQPVSTNAALSAYINNPLSFHDISQGNILAYQVDIMDATMQTVLYSTGLLSGAPPTDIDLYHLCDGVQNCTALPNSTTGTVAVTLSVTSDLQDPNMSVYTGLVDLSSPATNPVSVAFSINSMLVVPETPTIFNGPQTLTLDNYTSGDVAVYRIDVKDATTHTPLYSTGYVYDVMPSSIDLWNMCANSQNPDCSTLSSSETGTFEVTVWASSLGIDDPTASTYTGVIMVNPAIIAPHTLPEASFLVEGTKIDNNKPTLFFNCNSVQLTNTSTGDIGSYKIEIMTADMKDVLFSTGYVSGNFNSVNLLNMCQQAQNCTSLNPSMGGTFGVKLWVGTTAYDDQFGSAITGLIAINPALVSSNTTFITSSLNATTATQVNYMTASTSVSSPDVVGRSSTVFSLLDADYNYTYVEDYTLSISMWDAVNLKWLPNSWSEQFINSHNTLTPYMVPIGVLGAGFFDSKSNAAPGSIWRLEVTLHNKCGNFQESEIFQIDDTDFQ